MGLFSKIIFFGVMLGKMMNGLIIAGMKAVIISGLFRGLLSPDVAGAHLFVCQNSGRRAGRPLQKMLDYPYLYPLIIGVGHNLTLK
jgi:hypothetical protein